MRKKYQKGQTLLLVLLSMAVVLTIILSILSRSITDITITTKEEDALRAFSAAEAGIEKALFTGTDISDLDFEGASFDVTVSDLGANSREYVYPVKIGSGETATMWFVDHDPDTNELTCDTGNCFTGTVATFCWGDDETAADSSTTPALEVSIFYLSNPGDFSTATIARGAYDPYASRDPSSNFQSPDLGVCSIDGRNFAFQKTITFSDLGIPASAYDNQNGLQFARLRLLFNSDVTHDIGMNLTAPGNSFPPSQGISLSSSGSFGEANRRIEVFQPYRELPPIFDQVIFSPGGIVK